MFHLELLPAAVLQQLFATQEATRPLHDFAFEAEADLEGEVQAIHTDAMDACIVSLARVIQALSEY